MPVGQELRSTVWSQVLPRVRTPGQYTGGERNSIAKDHATLDAKVCLAFPDTYSLGMSHHGMQILYAILNDRPEWCCERTFCPEPDFEAELRQRRLPLFSLETYTPLARFDIVGFSLQYEVCYTNLLTMLDLGGLGLYAADRAEDAPLVIAGGPGAQNPELLAPFIDVFVIGDGEDTLPELVEKWTSLRRAGGSREDRIAALVASCPWAYAPRFYEPEYLADGSIARITRTRKDVPTEVQAAIIRGDFDDVLIPTRPIVANVEVVQERIAIEVMRGCPWQCRFCQATVLKRPLRVRSVRRIVDAAREAYANTGLSEIAILSLSTSDYPFLGELVDSLAEEFAPKAVSISVPSLRINEQFRNLPKLMRGVRKSGLTLAPEVARDDMREQIRKPIDNENLFDGCRLAFEEGWRRVKLYFMCGLPGERRADLDGIIEIAERISTIGKEVTGRYVDVTASVSNFVPKPHTPYQWNGMQTREYFMEAHRYLRSRLKLRSVKLKCHSIDRSLLEGILTRGDRRIAPAIVEAYRRGARLDAWEEYFQPELWWDTFRDLGIDTEFYSQRTRPTSECLPWDAINVKKGRDWLEKEHGRALVQLDELARLV